MDKQKYGNFKFKQNGSKVKFRFVILDDFDQVIEVLHETHEFDNKYDPDWSRVNYHWVLKLSEDYDFHEPDQVPNIETQIFVDGEWKHYSDPVEDWYNL
jgi:hypothetical protein